MHVPQKIDNKKSSTEMNYFSGDEILRVLNYVTRKKVIFAFC